MQALDDVQDREKEVEEAEHAEVHPLTYADVR